MVLTIFREHIVSVSETQEFYGIRKMLLPFASGIMAVTAECTKESTASVYSILSAILKLTPGIQISDFRQIKKFQKKSCSNLPVINMTSPESCRLELSIPLPEE